jgi:hypothetical protein
VNSSLKKRSDFKEELTFELLHRFEENLNSNSSAFGGISNSP